MKSCKIVINLSPDYGTYRKKFSEILRSTCWDFAELQLLWRARSENRCLKNHAVFIVRMFLIFFFLNFQKLKNKNRNVRFFRCSIFLEKTALEVFRIVLFSIKQNIINHSFEDFLMDRCTSSLFWRHVYVNEWTLALNNFTFFSTVFFMKSF